jgi:signal recognition particle subunit SRP19
MPDHFYVYPEYVDRSIPRANGRRVPADIAPSSVTLEELLAATTALGFRATAESEKHYPARSFAYAGRVKVTKRAGTTKARFLVEVAKEIVRRRPAAARKG